MMRLTTTPWTVKGSGHSENFTPTVDAVPNVPVPSEENILVLVVRLVRPAEFELSRGL